MKSQLNIKSKAIKLRYLGYSYSEISEHIHISKSTLSSWLSNLKLPQNVVQILRSKSNNNHLLGAKAARDKRIAKTKQIKQLSSMEIKKIDDSIMLMLGSMLYWGEGTKEKESNVSAGVEFVNSDPRMCKFFVKWLSTSLKIDNDRLIISTYVHISHRKDSEKILSFWSNSLDYPMHKIKIYFTHTKQSTRRHMGSREYNGQLRIKVAKSTDLNRKISGWIDGIYTKSILT